VNSNALGEDAATACFLAGIAGGNGHLSRATACFSDMLRKLENSNTSS
jgi:hypothetical protein